MTDPLRWLNAGNAGPFTLDGTRTYVVGASEVAVIDPGPDVAEHIQAVASAVEGARKVTLVLTHGHADHAAAAPALSAEVGAEIVGPDGVSGVHRALRDGDRIETDLGALVAVLTPGHTPDHLSFHWRDRSALFAGDHLLGEGDTTWVAEYPGCVADYLGSFPRLRALDLAVIYPAHGPPLTDPVDALDRFEGHRRERIRQVREMLERYPGSDLDAILDAVYGLTLPPEMRAAARRSLEALVEHVRAADG